MVQRDFSTLPSLGDLDTRPPPTLPTPTPGLTVAQLESIGADLNQTGPARTTRFISPEARAAYFAYIAGNYTPSDGPRLTASTGGTALTESEIREAVRNGTMTKQAGIDALTDALREQGSSSPERFAELIVAQEIQDGIEAGTLDADGLPIAVVPDKISDPTPVRNPSFTQEELDAAEQLLGGTRSGRFNIFERERTPGPTINPLLRNIRQQAFDPLSAAGFLTAASNPTDAFDFTSFIQNQQNQPINTRAGFGSFGQGGVAGTGLLGGVQSALFGGGDLSPGQAAARQILEQQASPILQTIGSAGINPFFQDAARSDIARRIRGLSALEQKNPFAAFVGGRLNF